MRLWHKYLISVLPREQLVAQWRELSAIAGAIQKNGTPNHILVNYVINYDFDHFVSYTYYIREEMTKRGYRTMNNVWNKIVSLKPDYKLLPLHDIYPEEMNDTYWTICYYNLMEKWLRGGIKNEDWNKISNLDSQLNG